MERWPLVGKSGRCGEMAVSGEVAVSRERWPLWGGGRYGEVAVVGRWPLWGGGRCEEVAVVGRWPLVGRSGRCGEMAVVESWALWRVGH